MARYEWLDEHWRISIAFGYWKRYWPYWIRERVMYEWYEDFQQVMEMTIFMSWKDRMTAKEMCRTIQRELSSFLRSVGYGRKRIDGKARWRVIESANAGMDLAAVAVLVSCSSTLWCLAIQRRKDDFGSSGRFDRRAHA